MVLHLDYYSHDDLAEIVRQRCRALRWEFEPELLDEIAKRGRDTPRIALRLSQSARRVGRAARYMILTVDHLRTACEIERISDLGLDNVQQKYLALLGNGSRTVERAGVDAWVSDEGADENGRTVPPAVGHGRQDDGGLRNLTEIGQHHLCRLCALERRDSCSIRPMFSKCREVVSRLIVLERECVLLCGVSSHV